MRKFLDLIWRHFKIGCTSELLLLEVMILGGVLGVDYLRFGFRDLCLLAPFRVALADKTAYYAGAGLIVVFLLLVPIVIAVVRILSQAPSRFQVRQERAIVGHVAFSILLGYGAIIATNLRTLGGNEVAQGSTVPGYAFQPAFVYIIDLSSWVLGTLFSPEGALFKAVGVGGLITALLAYLHYKQTPEIVKDYQNACLLADLDPAYVPIDAPSRLNFSESALAAEVPFTRASKERYVRQYFRTMPGSDAARESSQQLRRHCYELLRRVLEIPESVGVGQIELYPTTGRALEVALGSVANLGNVVVSPYEHRNTVAVVDWWKAYSGATVVTLSGNDYQDWATQCESIISELGTLLVPNRVNVLITSEINRRTGMVLPLDDLIPRVRAKYPQCRLKVIIEASQSVGNAGRMRFLSCADSYLFAAHKWLMSSEPCGVLVHSECPPRHPYDAWCEEAPRTTTSINALAGLAAALELIDREGLLQLWARSTLLQETFLERIRKKHFDVLGEKGWGEGRYAERTYISCVKPAAGYRWRPDFMSLLNKATLGIAVNDADKRAEATVSVAFPYFVSIWRLNQLCAVLGNAVQQFGLPRGDPGEGGDG